MVREPEGYKTTDLGLASVLSLSGKKYETFVRNGKVNFVFSDDEETEKIVKSYFASDLYFDAHTFFMMLDSIKNEVMQIRSNNARLY